MKMKIAIFALAVLCSAPAFAAHGDTCAPWLCGNTVIDSAPVTASGHAVMWPPGPTLWGFVMNIFGG